MQPKFTDARRFQLPYADAHATQQPGYLAARFERYRALQQQARANVKPIRKQAKGG